MTYLAAKLFYVKRDVVDRMTSYRTEPTEKLLQEKLFWPWKWCPSHVWRGLPLCQF